MKCQHDNCPASATCAVVINIPALDHVIAEHDPILLITGLRVCQAHALAFDAKEFIRLNPQVIDIAKQMCQMHKKADPDPARAFPTALDFDTPDWRGFCAMEAAKPDSGAGRILAERKRQIIEKHFLPDHDAAHDAGELAEAAVCYASDTVLDDSLRLGIPDNWPWDADWWKPSQDRIRTLEKAGALIAAEIDRLLEIRKQSKPRGPHGPS